VPSRARERARDNNCPGPTDPVSFIPPGPWYNTQYHAKEVAGSIGTAFTDSVQSATSYDMSTVLNINCINQVESI